MYNSNNGAPQTYNGYHTTNIIPQIPYRGAYSRPYLYGAAAPPPQFVTIVNKATNYISSSPYSLITPMYAHAHPPSPASSTSSKTSDHDRDDHSNMDDMLQHFALSSTTYGNDLWRDCFEDIDDPLSDGITLCHKCEEQRDDPDRIRSNTVSSSLMSQNKDYYHNSCFHFIFAIENLGVFEFCKYCFMENNNKKRKDIQDIEDHTPFHLDTYLNHMISEQIQDIASSSVEQQRRVHVELNIDELITHCKQCGMTDSFIDELRACYAYNGAPHATMDLQCIQQMKSSTLRISIKPNAHIHCIIYHPKIGCMEFCGSCNKMRSTFCDNPATLNKQSVSNLIHESKMENNGLSLSAALRRLFHFYISRYKHDTNILNIFASLRSYMDLNKRLNLAIPKPAGPLAPHAMLRMNKVNKPHRNRSSSSASSSPSSPNKLSNEAKSTQSASFAHHRHQNHHYESRRRHKSSSQHFRYRYNKRRAAYFNKHKKGKSEFTTHNIICITPRTPSYSYDDNDDKCLSVPPLNPMIRANSASNVTPNVNYGRPISMLQMGQYNRVNTVELAQSVRSLGSRSQAPSETPVHSVQNGLNPAWSNPYATGSIIDVRNGPGSFNDASSLSSLPMSPAFSYASLPNLPVSPFVYNSTSNISHHSSSNISHHSSSAYSDLLNPVEILNHQYNALTNNNNYRLNQFLNNDTNDDDKKKQKEKEKEKEIMKDETEANEENKCDEDDDNDDDSHSTDNKDNTKDKAQEHHDQQEANRNMNNMNNMSNMNVNMNMNMMSYPMNLINVNSGTTLQTAPLQLKPPFIPLSTVPQYYVLNKDSNVSSLCQLPLHIQVQLMQQGLPQNALILPIDQMQNFKRMLQANSNNTNFVTNLSNNNTSHQQHNQYGNTQNTNNNNVIYN